MRTALVVLFAFVVSCAPAAVAQESQPAPAEGEKPAAAKKKSGGKAK